ncbi:hypothetical protein B0H14DRAFT_2567771 [Mycena olivaceomarginata]|nr:hypothetical protein B0H14DRAFT_2567771 [Mycena olivaceomarginata]
MSAVEDEVGRWVDQRGLGRAGRGGVDEEQMILILVILEGEGLQCLCGHECETRRDAPIPRDHVNHLPAAKREWFANRLPDMDAITDPITSRPASRPHPSDVTPSVNFLG